MENGDGGSVIIMCEGKIREYFQRVFIFFNGIYGITLIVYLFFIIYDFDKWEEICYYIAQFKEKGLFYGRIKKTKRRFVR